MSQEDFKRGQSLTPILGVCRFQIIKIYWLYGSEASCVKVLTRLLVYQGKSLNIPTVIECSKISY